MCTLVKYREIDDRNDMMMFADASRTAGNAVISYFRLQE